MEDALSTEEITPPEYTDLGSARRVWMSRLIDTSRRNNLLYFRDLKVGSLSLDTAEADLIARLFNGDKLALRRLVSAEEDAQAPQKLREIVRKAQSNLEEKGIQTLFLAFGMATWPVFDEGRAPEAAIILLPITVEGRRSDPDSMTIQAAGNPQPNIALLHALDEEFKIKLPEESVIESGNVGDSEFDASAVLAFIREKCASARDFEIKPRCVIGNFSFQKLAMVQEMRESVELMSNHPMLCALAGDVHAREAFNRHRRIVPLEDLDKIRADDEFFVLDADSSQQAVIHSIAKDSDGVIQGPPGCGKSQTIANLITTLIAQGKKVLFVAEKRAALEAVFKRLDERNLGHLTLDLHGATVSQKAVIVKAGETLEKIRRAPDPQDVELHRKFEDRRERMIAHDRAMHVRYEPSGRSPYELQAEIIETAKVIASSTRWRSGDLVTITADSMRSVLNLLAEGHGLASLLTRTDRSPWTHANLPTGDSAQNALDAAQQLSGQLLPRLNQQLEALCASALTAYPNSLEFADRLVGLLVETNAYLRAWKPAILDDLRSMQDLQPAARGAFASLWASLSQSGFRSARRRVAGYSQTGVRNPKALYDALVKGEELMERWSTMPRTIEGAEGAGETIAHCQRALALLTDALPDLSSVTLSELQQNAQDLAYDHATAHAIPPVRALESKLEALGMKAVLEEIRAKSIPREQWEMLVRNAYANSCYDAVRIAAPALAGFRGDTHSQFAEEFRNLDRERLRIAAMRVSRAHAERAITAMNFHPAQTLVLKSEVNKRIRHLPLRRLLNEAGDVLTAVCPCWMLSPLNVSQLLPADRQYFDVVIFDEASQVLPQDAVAAILRGKRLVVAGDRHQLPPTNFFADGANEDDEESIFTGYESLLDQMSSFVDQWYLDWHYRSRDERLIAFSNLHIYENRLTTFPGVGGSLALSHVLVDSVPQAGQEESSSAEVDRVVELILQHAYEQVTREVSDRESLGVIAFGIKHAERIERALDKQLDVHRDVADFLDTSSQNPWFFLKNLERVQGDERDAIILSVGYGKDASGRLPYRFGPLLRQGGERRLNVAITRARKRLTVVSSFTHTDMDPERSDKRGVALLRAFLEFVASAGSELLETTDTEATANGMEADIFSALSARGIPLVAHYGMSGYRLDFAAMHPTREDEFVLAIECDGPAYHSAPTARDRDRLRQQMLESIGWRFHRIWSTDWFLRREEEIERAVAAWEHAVRSTDNVPVPVSLPFTGEAPPIVRSEVPPEVNTPKDYVRLVRWIKADELLRTDEELISEALRLMGNKRRGAKIVRDLMDAIRDA